MKLPTTTLGLSLLCASVTVNALKLSVTGRRTNRLGRRANVAGSSPLENSADIQYHTNLTLNGVSFSALIDTGSADLWVAGTVPSAVDSGKTSSVTYAVGNVSGPIKYATFSFAGFTVENQAFLEVTPNGTNPEGTGLIGLGPVGGSNIYDALGESTKGASPMDRIFMTDTSTPNYLAVFLGRLDDPLDIFSGDISIGEVHQNFSDVLKQPKLEVTVVPVRQSGDQHFQVLLDTDGIYGPTGNAISVSTEVDETSNKKQATAILDTGFSLSQVPKSVADQIYAGVPGAEFTNVQGIGKVWVVPCTQEVNITFKIGGQKYPIHPMDSTLDPTLLGLSSLTNDDGDQGCLGMFQPMSFDRGSNPTYDIILGMSFIRNVYAVFNYGDFIAGSSGKADPYIQLLSTTNLTRAHADFVSVRLGGVDTTGSQIFNVVQTSNNNDNTVPFYKKIKPTYLIIGAVALGLAALIAAVSIFICCRRRQRKAASWGTYRPIDSQRQHPLNGQMHDPAPPGYNPKEGGVYDTHTYEKYADYNNPWDHRY